MPRLNRRSKVVSIRLSGKEYDELLNLCIAKGADSISELARRAMKMMVCHESTNNGTPIESRVNEIHTRVTVMDREIARLSNMLGVSRLEMEPPRDEAAMRAIGDPI